MKLSKKNAARQREILRRVKAGLPLAGLLTGMAVLTGCDNLKPVGTEPRTVGKEPAPVKLAGDEPALVRTAGEELPPPPPPPPRPLAGLPVTPDKSPKGK